MTREEQIRKASEEFARGIASIRPELNADSFRQGAKWADEHPNGSIIHWQTGEPPKNGTFLVTYKGCVYKFQRERDFWMCCGRIMNDKDVSAWCKLSDIKPYKEEANSNRPFKIGDLVVENRIVGVVVELQNEGILKVIGAALMKMYFNESMCRKATSDEALSINARWREQGFYYDINVNKLKPYKEKEETK